MKNSDQISKYFWSKAINKFNDKAVITATSNPSVSLLIFKAGQIHSRHKTKMEANYNWTKTYKNYQESFLWLNLVCKARRSSVICHVAIIDGITRPRGLQKMTNQLAINIAMKPVKANHPVYSWSHQKIRYYFVLRFIVDTKSCDFHQKQTLKDFYFVILQCTKFLYLKNK